MAFTRSSLGVRGTARRACGCMSGWGSSWGGGGPAPPAGGEPLITSAGRDVERAEALIVPGVGAAADTMRNLRRHSLVEPIRGNIAGGGAVPGGPVGQPGLFALSGGG